VLEVKAAFLATKRLCHYLLGIEFDLVTDCAAFKQTISKKDVPREVTPWLMYLQDFTFNVEHRAGTRMQHVDSLSRFPIMIVSSVREILKHGPYADYINKNNLIYKQVNGQELLAVPKCMEKEIITSSHNFGHMGTQKTMHAIQQDFHISHLEKKVKQTISNCIECITHNHKLGKQDDFLHAINKGDTPLSTLHVDHLGSLDMTSKSYRYIFAVADDFSKYTWLFPTKSTNAEKVIKHLESWVSMFGSPQRIISDKEAAFTSHSFKEFCTAKNIVPRGNGQIERVNRIIISEFTARHKCTCPRIN